MESEMSARREWMDEVDALHEHPGFIAEAELRHLDMSWSLFERNYHELKKYLSLYYDPVQSVKFWDKEKRDLLESFSREITRMLFNMTSPAMMLVDHTRVKMKELHEKTPLDKCYQSKVKQTFSENDLHQFVQGLRNYFTHRALPYLSSQFT
ncbi:MAG: hypothetical protein GX962_09530 [Epulopiscium sp.]|nr:hypothetical protein [Candidatus Epulonipiscium sp.]